MRLCHPAVSWAKVVRGVEPANGRGGYAFSGPFLHKNGQNDVPIGSIPITSHEVGSRRHPRPERVASLVWIDADDQPLRVPIGSGNRTDLDFRDYVAGYLSMPAARRAARLLDALYSGEPGPHNAISSQPDRERRLITQYADAIQNTIEALETVGATGRAGRRRAPAGDRRHETNRAMTLHAAPVGAEIERRDANGETQTVIVLSHFSNLFATGTTYRRYGSGTVLTLEETADVRTHPEAAGDWTRTDTDRPAD